MANRINVVVNLPVFNEKQELAILIKIVQALDRNTFKFIPKEVLEVAFTGRASASGRNGRGDAGLKRGAGDDTLYPARATNITKRLGSLPPCTRRQGAQEYPA